MVVTPAFASDQTWMAEPPPLPDNTAALLGYHGSGIYEATGSAAPLAPSRDGRIANWRGFYIGGQFGYSDGSADFTKSTQAPIAYSLRELTLESEFSPSNWPVLGTANHGAAGFGGFVGYNYQYERGILGIEANYDQASLSFFAPNSPISRVTPADNSGNVYSVNITGSGRVTDLDYGTVRARGGWALGNFLPYGFVGVAIGRANVNITETTSGVQTPTLCGGVACVPPATPPAPTPFSFPGTAGHNSEWLYGVTVGAGLDVALTRNVFVRAEYEYVQFVPVASTLISINTARVGAGIKF